MNQTNNGLGIVPENNPILNDINALSDDVRKLVKIFSESFSYPWQESKERARELNKVWWTLFKKKQVESSLTVNEYAKTLPLQIEGSLQNASMFFAQLLDKDWIEPYLYAFICEELNMPWKKAKMQKEKLFNTYLNRIVMKILRQLLQYRISEWEFEQRIQGS